MDFLKKLKFVGKGNEIKINNSIVGKDLIIIAGPCGIESEEQFLSSAKFLKDKATLLRAHLFKPRTNPYSFQGLGEKGLNLLEKAKKIKIPLISEIMESSQIEILSDYIDAFQIGARNMQNFNLLKAIGKTDKPIILKRGISATIEEWVNAAEYIMKEGNLNVIFCERGIRTYSDVTRNTLDLSVVPLFKKHNLPIIVDPCHGTGMKELIAPMSKAAIAAGTDGLLIEVHPNPAEALSDSNQQLNFTEFDDLFNEVKKLNNFLK